MSFDKGNIESYRNVPLKKWSKMRNILSSALTIAIIISTIITH